MFRMITGFYVGIILWSLKPLQKIRVLWVLLEALTGAHVVAAAREEMSAVATARRVREEEAEEKRKQQQAGSTVRQYCGPIVLT